MKGFNIRILKGVGKVRVFECKKVQNVSSQCVVCGEHNPFSLMTKFFELDDDYLVGVFLPKDHHQSYPGRMHGGMISSVIDETIGRAVQIKDPSMWGVTGELKVRFLKPTPLGEELHCFAKLTMENSRMFKGVAILETSAGELLATGSATYVKLDVEKIAEGGLDEKDWFKCETTAPQTITLHNDEKLNRLLEV